jgi:hypothetical protein
MANMQTEALRIALEALELHGKQYPHMVKGYCLDAITAIQQALAAPVQEPHKGLSDYVAQATNGRVYVDPVTGDVGIGTPAAPTVQEPVIAQDGDTLEIETILYTSPQRTWVGLTDEEIEQGCKESWVTEQAFQSAVWWAEAKLKEKNNG